MVYKVKHIDDPLKKAGKQLKVERANVPQYLYIASDNARCPKSEVFIKEGDYVKCGQVVGVRHASYFDQPIHATCSGKFVGFEKHYHRSGKLVNFLKFENDFKDTWDDSIKERSDEEITRLSKSEVVQILKDCASVGLGGSSFPSYVKLDNSGDVKTLLVNAVEVEPYIEADRSLMEEKTAEIVQGIKYLLHALNCHDARICVNKKYTGAISKLNSFLPGNSEIKIVPVNGEYINGWENKLIERVLKIKMKEGAHPAEYGLLMFNVSTIYGMYLNIKFNKPVIERVVSVSGNGISQPKNFLCRVGTKVQDLINYCGGYKEPDKDKLLVLGGPMMGTAIPSDDCICTKTVTSIIVMEALKKRESACINCGSCIRSCPANLNPVEIYNTMKVMPVNKDKVKFLNPTKCIECALCTYACPANINLAEQVKRAKVIARLK